MTWRRTPISAGRGLLALGLLWLSLGCAPPERAELPEGPLIAGDARALLQLLDALEGLEATPIAREARRARAAVQGCDQFLASSAGNALGFAEPACRDGRLPPELEALRGDAALAFVLPFGSREGAEPARLAGRVHVRPDGELRVEARLDGVPEAGGLGLLLPDEAPAGAPRLSSHDALVQARVRPRGGLDLSSLISSGSQADQMFRLKSQLFVGAALGDAWELAIYMPRSGATLPPMVVALDVARASLAKQGVAAFVRELEATWPLRARAATWPSGAVGQCFDELRIMPEFAPCHASVEGALIFGWNYASVEQAISTGPAGGRPTSDPRRRRAGPPGDAGARLLDLRSAGASSARSAGPGRRAAPFGGAVTRGAIGLLVGGLLLGAVVAADSLRGVQRQLEIADSCEAAARQDWADVLSRSPDLVGPDADGRYAAECRCWALLASERGDECTQLIEGILAHPDAADWVPDLALTKHVIRARRDRGELDAAAALAERGAQAHPDDLNLLHLDLALRGALEGEEPVLAAAEAGLSPDAASLPARVVLAASHRRRGDAQVALRVLGPRAPGRSSRLQGPWFEQRCGALADLGQAAELRAAFATWEAEGGDPTELRARYALLVSTSQLSAGVASVSELLRASLAERAQLRDPLLVRSLYERLIAQLVVEERSDEALAVYDTAVAEVELPTLTRAQLERRSLARSAPGESVEPGELWFVGPADGQGGTLFVSPAASLPADREFEAHRLGESGQLRLRRGASEWPVRWVLQDSQRKVRGSGAVWAEPGAVSRVDIVAADAAPVAAGELPARREADGRRRVFALVLDCADWRIVNYLRARGELAFLDQMLGEGHRALLDSWPPLTAAAMQSLVWPDRADHVSFLGSLHQLGLEVAGLASVGCNPLAFLDPLLPESPSLFEVVCAGEQVSANMLFAHGAIDAGRHAEMLGPHGQRRLAHRAASLRVLRPDEQARFPGLVADPRVRSRVETIASEFDVANSMAREAEVDLLLLRIESLDVLTHALYVELERGEQDDGRATLLEVYRYVDDRLAELNALLDADDVLVVMSDHGIKNPMEHDRQAIFVASGAGVPAGRAPGTPELRGVPRVLADLLGVDTDWDDTGVAPWLGGRAVEQSVAVVGVQP
jgi:hypothetical protein